MIEIDGGQHTSPEHRKADMLRDAALSKWGITVLRYTNIQVNQNFSAVTGDILRHLGLIYDDMP